MENEKWSNYWLLVIEPVTYGGSTEFWREGFATSQDNFWNI